MVVFVAIETVVKQLVTLKMYVFPGFVCSGYRNVNEERFLRKMWTSGGVLSLSRTLTCQVLVIQLEFQRTANTYWLRESISLGSSVLT